MLSSPAPLPPHLEQLVKRAVRNELPDLTTSGLNTPAGTNFYTLAWAVSYFTSGDQGHALMRLENVHKLAQQAAKPEPEPEPEPEFKTYPIPAGTKAKKCKSCGAEMFFVITENGEKLPVTEDGRSHFETCDDPKRFSKKTRRTKGTK